MDQVRPNVFLDDAPPPGGERARDSLLLMATLHIGGWREPLTVRVRNLSPGGLMAELPEPIASDAAVIVEVRGLGRISGRVAWQTAGRAGIAFDRPVDPQRARKPIGAPVNDTGPFSRKR